MTQIVGHPQGVGLLSGSTQSQPLRSVGQNQLPSPDSGAALGAASTLDGSFQLARSLNLPETPGNVVAVAGEGSVKIYFDTAVRADSYKATSSSGLVVTGAASPLSYPQLPNGVALTFSVVGVNSLGQGTAAISNSVTPTALPAILAGIPNIMALFDAETLPVVANGTAMASWLDTSGNSRTAVQGTGGAQPTYVTGPNWGSAGTHPAVKFDGAAGAGGDHFVTGLTARQAGPQITVIAVLSPTALTNGTGAGDMRLLSTELTPRDRGFAITLNSASAGGGGGTNFMCVKGGSNEVNAGTDLIAVNVPVIVSVVTGKQHFMNGARYVPQFGTIAAVLPRDQPFTIGAAVSNGGGLALAGSIAFLMIVRGQMSDANRNAVEAALGTRYGISVVANPTV